MWTIPRNVVRWGVVITIILTITWLWFRHSAGPVSAGLCPASTWSPLSEAHAEPVSAERVPPQPGFRDREKPGRGEAELPRNWWRNRSESLQQGGAPTTLVAPLHAAPIETPPSPSCLPGDRWSYDGCLLIPQEQIGGITEIIFTTPRDPTQCRRLCQQSPTARFFSYWHETGSCHLHERLSGGETEPEAMTRYLYAIPQQHWLSGHVPKAHRPPNFFTSDVACD